MSKSDEMFGHPAWFRLREFRQRTPLGHSDAFYKRLYSSIVRCDSRENPGCGTHRGIYSMDFSPEGSLLVATYNRSGIQMLDPLRRNLIETVNNAHGAWVTKVKFLDSRTFATGSADMTVALWDVRNVKERLRTLRGHSNIVSNIEFSSQNDVLVTCGVDGMIHTWNLNNLAEERKQSRKVFGSHDFSGMRLNPDASKMIICSSRGYLLIVHNLDLNTLAEDLAGYDPGGCPFYHLQQMVVCSDVDVYSRSRKRNRVEPVTDFPITDDRNEVSALEIHPEGVSALSRSTRQETMLHCLCVHDIRGREPAGGWDESEGAAGGAVGASEAERDAAMEWQGATPPELRGRDEQQEGGEGCGEQNESALKSILRSIARMTLHLGESSRAVFKQRAKGEGAPPGPQEEVGSHEDPSTPKHKRPVRHTLPRLTHYVGGIGHVKWHSEELSFSPDGRLICSPFDSGIQLYTFSPECNSQFVSWSGGEPNPLHQFATFNYHESTVVSTKFSPCHCLIVSGCSQGNINWYQPIL